MLITRAGGTRIRGVRSLPDGTVPLNTLIDVPPGTPVIVTTRTEMEVTAEQVRTRPL